MDNFNNQTYGQNAYAKNTAKPVKPEKPEKPVKSKKNTALNTTAITISVFALVLSIVATSLVYAIYRRNGNEITIYNGADGNSVTFTEGSVAEVTAKVSSSVVSIVTETRTSSWYGSYSSNAAGTGFIVSEDGLVVTNKHVIEGARSVTIYLDDGTEYTDVEIVGRDPLNDVAILRIRNASGLPTIELGDSKTLHLGEQVLAIGNALGAYQNTVTYGIISGMGRSLTATDSNGSNAENLADMIQTDAAINGGNSGGPLINAAGQVIGINTAYASEGNSIGFAIPISSIKGLIRDVQKTGKVVRAVLGIRYYALDAATARENGYEFTSGAVISSQGSSVNPVTPGGAADKAGLKSGDIILSVNGVQIGAAGSLSTLIGEYSVGDTVQLSVYRDGSTFNVNATLQQYSE